MKSQDKDGNPINCVDKRTRSLNEVAASIFFSQYPSLKELHVKSVGARNMPECVRLIVRLVTSNDIIETKLARKVNELYTW